MELVNAHDQKYLPKSQMASLLNNPSSSKTNRPSSPSSCPRLSDEERSNDDISIRKNPDYYSQLADSNLLQVNPTLCSHPQY